MPKNARMIPQESNSTGLCNKPKRTAATAAVPVNQMSVAFLPKRSTAKAAAYLPGMEATTMIAVSRKATHIVGLDQPCHPGQQHNTPDFSTQGKPVYTRRNSHAHLYCCVHVPLLFQPASVFVVVIPWILALFEVAIQIPQIKVQAHSDNHGISEID